MHQTAVVFCRLFAASSVHGGGVFIASFLFRHSTDATSLVFEDCLFEANSVGGVGGGAGHITGTV